MDENEQRAALEGVRKDANDPTLSVGDTVFCGGVYATVTDIQVWEPGQHGNSPIRNDWTAVQVTTDTGGSRWHGREPQAPAVHIHVGHNVPGYLPESDVMCFDSVEDALEALRHEIKDQQDYYYDQCDGSGRCGGHGGEDDDLLRGVNIGETTYCDGSCGNQECECAWCSVASDCEAALSAIADGDAEFYLTRESEQYGRIGWIFTTPEGPGMHHWATRMDDLREDCEIFADQES